MIPTNETNKNKKKSPKKKNKKWHENPPAPCNTPVSDNMQGAGGFSCHFLFFFF